MANNDDFEIIDDAGLSNEQLFEFIDVKDVVQKNTSSSQPKTPEGVLPFLVPKPLVTELPPVVQQQQQQPTSIPSVNPPEEIRPPTTTTTSTTVRLEIKTTTTSPPPRIIPAVPPLPKAPPPQRFGNAALIPHNPDETSDIDAAINRSKKIQQSILHISSQQQQDIQTVLEQRRNVANKN